jgi:phthiodiolone/phenolphthiodiolone dimycocerosates ketoreductase
MTRKLELGSLLAYMPPAEMPGLSAKSYEDSGLDFVITGDQVTFMVPPALWTTDITPAAALVDIDSWMDCFAIAQGAAVATERVPVGVMCDALRRNATSLAQSLNTLDQFSKGRAFLSLGAGEAKQFDPYGVPRNKPFGHLEESIKIIKMLQCEEGPVDYEGPVWALKQARMRLQPFDSASPPPVFAAGSNGRALEIGAQHGDGWATWFPWVGEPEEYAKDVARAKEIAEKAGKDPDDLVFSACVPTILVSDEGELADLAKHPILKFMAGACVPHGAYWKRWGLEHPLGDHWAYARDLLPVEWDRDRCFDLIERVPDEAVIRANLSGTPKQVAARLNEFVEAGVNHLWFGNWTDILVGGDFGSAGEESKLLQMCSELRALQK